MTKPEMIIFDYGHTLMYEPNHSTTNGNKAIFNFISDNPNNISFEQFNKTCIELFARIKEARGLTEIHEHTFLRLFYEYINVKLSVSIEEAEKIVWNGISEGKIMPYTELLINYLNENKIRTGVISNLCFSSSALSERLKQFLPNNKFEFVLASSDYIFCKPNRMMFDIALRKSGLTADKVWYCGDSIKADVYGAHNAGIYPVLYEGETEEINPFAEQNDGLEVDFNYLHIHDWREMIDILEGLK